MYENFDLLTVEPPVAAQWLEHPIYSLEGREFESDHWSSIFFSELSDA